MMTRNVTGNGAPRFARVLAGAVAVAMLATGSWLVPTAEAATLETPAKHAFLVDMETGTVLFEKSPDELMPPASMSKMMTVYMVFDLLKKGKLSLTDQFRTSENAWKKGGAKSGGSTMFLNPGEMVKVEDLIQGIVVQSGNDACIVVAENLASSEESFAEQMTKRAREIGLTKSTFRNATGLPNPDHRVTARELAMIAKRTILDFPEYYHFYSERQFVHNNIKQGNRNPLLTEINGADGLKTGHTEESGYGLTATVKRGDRRLILVLNGLTSMKERAKESERIMEWGMREFENYKLFKAGETVVDADTWLGKDAKVPLVAESDAVVTLPRPSRSKMVVKAVYDSPVTAPIQKGTRVASLVISAPEMPDTTIPLVAGADVERLGVLGRLGAAVTYMIFGAKS